MRPIRLDLHGFAAFREPTRVDFAGAEYFALVGPTGSGKSTVIDAMTFALYGSVPRWDDRRTVALALSPTTNRGTVSLLFAVGTRQYLVARELRRSAAGGVTVRNARLELLLDLAAGPDGGTESVATDSGVSKAVEELLGLPFEQFCVCVVLPQGDFAQFLHAKPADRQKTLTRILGLGVYETIAKQAGSEAGAQRERAELLSGQLDGYADATDVEVGAAERREASLAALVERVASALPVLAAAEARVADAALAADRLRAEGVLLAGVRPPGGLAALTARVRDAVGRTAQARSALEQAEGHDTAVRELIAAAPEPGPLRQLRRDHAELAALDTALAGLAENRRRAGDAVRVAERHTAEVAAGRETARAALNAAAETRADTDAQLRRLAAERERLAAPRIPAEVAGVAAGRRAAAEELTRARRAVTEAEAVELAARDAVAAAAHELGAARGRYDELTRADQAAALRAELVAGEPCPVCARRVEQPPPPAGRGGLPPARAALRTASAQLDRASAAAAETDRCARAARRARDEAEHADVEAGRQVAAAVAQLRAVRDPLVALGAPAPGDDLVGSWRALAGWAALAAADRAGVLADAPGDTEAAERLAGLDVLTARAKAADTALRSARAALAEASGAAEQLGEQVRQAWRELAAARDPVVGLGAPAHHGASAEELVAACAALTEWARRQRADRERRLPDAERAVTEARAGRDHAREILAGDLAALGVVPAPAQPLASAAPVAVAAALERARGAAARLRERQAEATRLAGERDSARTAHQVASTLARLLRSNEFPRWLVASALDTLVVDASRRLAELSGGQFELTHSDGEFQVVDHADADARRPVKTLSGGETFQASLALALALSEQLSTLASAGAARLDSIFLDEGFGTLDEANLEIVAGTLENLASLGDRMVGVVTHVPALAERVPVRYVVSRDQRTASIVRDGPA